MMRKVVHEVPLILAGTHIQPLGYFWVITSDEGLCQIGFGLDKHTFLQRAGRKFPLTGLLEEPSPHPAAVQMEEYLAGERRHFTLPIDWRWMSPFQAAVYREVLKIPYGETTTYQQIAKQIGKPNAARAVGAANAANPLPIIIPCHRLVGADGSLRGYGSGRGIETKAWLIDLEKTYAKRSS